MSKCKYTTKAATVEGFYWIKNIGGTEFPAQYLGNGLWSRLDSNGFVTWPALLKYGYKRSVEELKP